MLESLFRIFVGEWFGQLKLLKRNATKDVFRTLLELSKTSKTCDFTNPVALIKCLIIDIYQASFQLFQDFQGKHGFWILFVLKSEILDCRPVILEKKDSFATILSESSKFRNIVSFLSTSRTVSMIAILVW